MRLLIIVVLLAVLAFGAVRVAAEDAEQGEGASGEPATMATPLPAPAGMIGEQELRDALQLSDQHTALQAPLRFPRRAGRVAGEQVHGVTVDQLSEAEVGQLIDAAARYLAIPEEVRLRVQPGLIRVVNGESDRRPALVQQVRDANSAYPHRARGLFQLTPWLFRASYVPPFDNIYAPFDNTLAALQIYWAAPSRRGHILSTVGDQIDSCGQLMIRPRLQACAAPGVWPQSPGWTTMSYTPWRNAFLSEAQRSFAQRTSPYG